MIIIEDIQRKRYSEYNFIRNVLHIYESSYKDLHEILTNVGGIVKVIIQSAS